MGCQGHISLHLGLALLIMLMDGTLRPFSLRLVSVAQRQTPGSVVSGFRESRLRCKVISNGQPFSNSSGDTSAPIVRDST